MSHVFLTGGGRDPGGGRRVSAAFADAVRATGRDEVALLVLDEGDPTPSGEWHDALSRAGLAAEVFVVAPGRRPPRVGDAAGVFVAGGLTPGYQEALCGDPSWLPPDAVYGGFSAGAAIAPEVAIVGGWRSGGVPVCDEESGEGLADVEIRSGLALLEAVIDVHCSQWGTLGRLVEVVRGGDGRPGWGLDEHTTLELRDGAPVAVHGKGAAWEVTRLDDDRVAVRPRLEGPL
jgi:cyanophycinase